MTADRNTSFYDIIFETECNLSERFLSLNPFIIRRTAAHEVFLLMRRLIKSSGKTDSGKEVMNRNGKRIIRRPAGDNWF